MKSKSESNHTEKTGANRGDANGIWYVSMLVEKKGTLKQLKLTMLVRKEIQEKNQFHSLKKQKGTKGVQQSHARIPCCQVPVWDSTLLSCHSFTRALTEVNRKLGTIVLLFKRRSAGGIPGTLFEGWLYYLFFLVCFFFYMDAFDSTPLAFTSWLRSWRLVNCRVCNAKKENEGDGEVSGELYKDRGLFTSHAVHSPSSRGHPLHCSI